MGAIFISYRRKTDAGYAGRIHDHLGDELPSAKVFLDVDGITAGADFKSVLRQKIAECDVLLALIGSEWLGMTSESGERRLDDPEDHVRQEIEGALRAHKLVIPVLLGDASLPAEAQLPGYLKRLTDRNAVHVRHESFRSDMERILSAIRTAISDPLWPPVNGLQNPSRKRLVVAAFAVGILCTGAVGYFVSRPTCENESDCGNGKYCSARGTCLSLPGLNEPCSSTRLCEPGLSCVQADNTCRKLPLGLLASCDGSDQCRAGLDCLGGSCTQTESDHAESTSNDRVDGGTEHPAGDEAAGSAPPTPPAEILELAATPQRVAAGGEVVLTWKTAQASEVRLNQKRVDAADRVAVKPSRTTIYSLQAQNKDGQSTERNVTVEVLEPVSLARTSFTMPTDGRSNANARIGPFCCTGRTATVLDTKSRPVGYVYAFDWQGQALNVPRGSIVPDIGLLVSGLSDPHDPESAQQKNTVTFRAATATLGQVTSVQAGALTYTARLSGFERQQHNGTAYFEMGSVTVVVKVKLSTSVPRNPSLITKSRLLKAKK